MAVPSSQPNRSWDNTGPVRWIRRYMGYTRGEVRGMLTLLAGMLAVAVAPMLLRPDLPVYLPAQDQQELDKLVASLREHRLSTPAYASRYPRRTYEKAASSTSRYPKVPQVRLAPFNPNALKQEDWEARGVPHFVAQRLVKYRDAAGSFRAKAQIKKMYGLEDSVYQRLAPFMQLPEELPSRGSPEYAAAFPDKNSKAGPFAARPATPGKFPSKPKNLQPFDLNTADTTQLMQIRGIGRGRAKWVVQQRNLLGGYVREEQLDEIFVLRDAPDLRDSLKKYTFVAPSFTPQLVSINTASFDELYLHPYIRKGLARQIVAYRQQHGPFKKVEDLKQLPTLKAEDWEKLRPYVRCD